MKELLKTIDVKSTSLFETFSDLKVNAINTRLYWNWAVQTVFILFLTKAFPDLKRFLFCFENGTSGCKEGKKRNVCSITKMSLAKQENVVYCLALGSELSEQISSYQRNYSKRYYNMIWYVQRVPSLLLSKLIDLQYLTTNLDYQQMNTESYSMMIYWK